MEDELNPEAAAEFAGEAQPEQAPVGDVKMVVEAILADQGSLQMLAQALAPLLGLTGTESEEGAEEAPAEEEVE